MWLQIEHRCRVDARSTENYKLIFIDHVMLAPENESESRPLHKMCEQGRRGIKRATVADAHNLTLIMNVCTSIKLPGESFFCLQHVNFVKCYLPSWTWWWPFCHHEIMWSPSKYETQMRYCIQLYAQVRIAFKRYDSGYRDLSFELRRKGIRKDSTNKYFTCENAHASLRFFPFAGDKSVGLFFFFSFRCCIYLSIL